MNKQIRFLSYGMVLSCAILFSACYTEDPGPLQQTEQQYSIIDFDRLEMGSAFTIDVKQGEYFSISASGDSRNLDDLRVRKVGSTLVIDFDDNHNRKHETEIKITMPSLRSVNFSGASDSRVTGFTEEEILDLNISGASTAQIDTDASSINVHVSGASTLRFTGTAAELDAEVSGASVLNAFNLIVDEAHVHASGASEAKVTVETQLHATASGASSILYRGNPGVTKNVSGASSVQAD